MPSISPSFSPYYSLLFHPLSPQMILKARKKDLKVSIRRDMQLALEKKIRKVTVTSSHMSHISYMTLI